MTSRGVAVRLALAVVLFDAFDYSVFRTGTYASYLEPNSTAGAMVTDLRLEKERYRPGTPRVLALGDSRMALLLRVSDAMAAESGHLFDEIALAGTHPRCWYYMLREVDPHADKYSAIVIPMASYEDEDWENLADSEVDIHYLVPLLRARDALEFSSSFESWGLRWMALRDTLVKGLAYKRDLWAFWADPKTRMSQVNWTRENAAQAYYAYLGSQETMEGLRVDWNARKITQYPPGANEETRRVLDIELLRNTGQYTGKRTAYLRTWLGRIAERYRNSRTRLLFIRLPRGPVVRPYVPYAPTSAVREIAARGRATAIGEHYFDSLERPELFHDAVHLNENGCRAFTVALAREVRRALGQLQNAL